MRILTCNSYKGLGPKILVKKNKWHRGRVGMCSQATS